MFIRLAKEFETDGTVFSTGSSGYVRLIPSLREIRLPEHLLTLEAFYALLNNVLGWKKGKLQCNICVKKKGRLLKSVFKKGKTSRKIFFVWGY